MSCTELSKKINLSAANFYPAFPLLDCNLLPLVSTAKPCEVFSAARNINANRKNSLQDVTSQTYPAELNART